MALGRLVERLRQSGQAPCDPATQMGRSPMCADAGRSGGDSLRACPLAPWVRRALYLYIILAATAAMGPTLHSYVKCGRDSLKISNNMSVFHISEHHRISICRESPRGSRPWR